MESRAWMLVVEDDDGARQGLLELLTSPECDAVGASNGQQALDLLEGAGAPPILILLDLQLPRVTGWEILRYVHDDEKLRFTPVIVMTGTSNRSVDLVADEVFTKPLDVGRLLRSVRRFQSEDRGGPGPDRAAARTRHRKHARHAGGEK